MISTHSIKMYIYSNINLLLYIYISMECVDIISICTRVKIFEDLQRSPKISKDLRKSSEVFENLQTSLKISKDLWRSSGRWIIFFFENHWNRVEKAPWTCHTNLRFFHFFRFLKIFGDIWRYLEMFEDFRRFWKIFEKIDGRILFQF